MAEATQSKREEALATQLTVLAETTTCTTADLIELQNITNTQFTELKDHTATKINELSDAIAHLTCQLLRPTSEPSTTQPPPHPPGFTPLPENVDPNTQRNSQPQPQHPPPINLPYVPQPQIPQQPQHPPPMNISYPPQPQLPHDLNSPQINQHRYPHPQTFPQSPANYNQPEPFYIPPPPHHQPRPFKLDLPRFDGTDPKGWLFKANQFFDFHQTGPHHRLQIASFHMDSEASAWYQWMQINYRFTSWQIFAQSLEERSGDSPYKSNVGALAKLVQTSTVADYISKYEALANRTSYLQPEFLHENFISGLKPHLQQEVQAL